MKKKGFTLVEMLVVVTLVGLLMFVIVSNVKPSIDDSKEATFFASTNSLVKSFEQYYFEQKLKGNFGGCSYNFSSGENNCDGLDYTGTVPDGGLLTLSVDGIINGTVIFNDQYNYEVVDNVVVDKSGNEMGGSNDTTNKLDLIPLPHKENMTYYFDYESNIDSTIENYSTGNVNIVSVNASVVDDSIYFSGNNRSYAYTEDYLGENESFTIYLVAKFSGVYSYNYMISSVSFMSSDDFGIGIGRHGTGHYGQNQLIFMSSDAYNCIYTDYDVLNYYVHTIVYDNGVALFYLNGNFVGQIHNVSSSSKFYFGAYLNMNDNKVYGGALINFKQFSFVDGVHNSVQIAENSSFLQEKYILD